MKVLVLRGFCTGNGMDVYPGETVDLPDWQVVVKIQSGHVTLAPAEVEHRDPEPMHRDPIKRGKKYGK